MDRNKLYSIEDYFDFGKYNGKSIHEVSVYDIEYIYWCIHTGKLMLNYESYKYLETQNYIKNI